MEKYALIFGVFCIICMIPLYFWMSSKAGQQATEHFERFDKANIKGVIQSVGSSHHKAGFKIKGVPEKYIFHARTDEKLNESSTFTLTAKEGDSVIKPPYADTLLLIKEGKVLKYEFFEYENGRIVPE